MANVLNVNPNRMELMRLAKRLALAKRGHRLLKDKQDELMERFIKATNKVQRIRREVEKKYSSLKKPYFTVKYISDSDAFGRFCRRSPFKAEIKGNSARVMNIEIPEIEVSIKGDFKAVGRAGLAVTMPVLLRRFIEMLPDIAELANAERQIYLIAEELEKVRRRVNALEYIFIPKIEETVEYISMQLEEMERESITRLMKIKDIVRSR